MKFFSHINIFALITIAQASTTRLHHYNEQRQLRKANTVKGMNGANGNGGKQGKLGMTMKFKKNADGGMAQVKHTSTPTTSPLSVQSPEEMTGLVCFAEVDIECIPPINPLGQNGERFKDCDSIIIENLNCSASPCYFPISFNIAMTNTDTALSAEITTLSSITNFDTPNNFLNFTSEVSGKILKPGETATISTATTDIDFSVAKRYTVFTVVEEVSPDGFYCRGSDFLAFTVGR
jgi:hypothetical protein